MKNIYFLTLLFFSQWGISFGQNLLTNVTFEANTNHWEVIDFAGATGNLSRSTTESYGGNASGKVSVTASNGAIGQVQLRSKNINLIPLESGKTYELRFWVKSDQPRADAMGITVGQNSPWSLIGANTIVSTTTSWSEKVHVFTSNANYPQTRIQIQIGSYVENYNFDNFTLSEIPTPEPTSLAYVSPSGNDGNAGTLAAPFKTLGVAVAALNNGGGSIILRDGVYRERVDLVNESSSAVTIQSFGNEKVVLTGLDEATNWIQYAGNIYYTSVNQEVTQVFVEETQMKHARWPNYSSNDPFDQVYGSGSVVVNSGANSTVTASQLSSLPDLTGAQVWLPYPLKTKWNSYSSEVTSHSGSTLNFTLPFTDYDESANGVIFHVTGKLELLDTENEWFYDELTGRLYFYAPGGVDPENLNVQLRTRIEAINVTGDNVTIKGLEFFASTINISGNNSTIDDCLVYYPRPYHNTARWQQETGVSVNGNLNVIKNCEVAYSWGSGISMRSSTNEIGTIDNNLVHDCNWTGSIAPGIWISGTAMTASRNTVYSVGRSGIRHYPIYNSLLELNHIYDYGKINKDLGSIKGGGQDYEGTIWRFNLSRDTNGNDGTKSGIYLDVSNDNAFVYHNVNVNAHMAINGEVNNNHVYNNTFVSTSTEKTMGHFQRFNSWDYRTVYTRNNLATNNFLGTTLSNNLENADINSDVFGFVGPEYFDFRLKSTSTAIDYGTGLVSGTTGNTGEGAALDAGAYEFGVDNIYGNWFPGITWSPEWNSTPNASISVQSTGSNSVNFIVSNATDDGFIMRYDWDFGDGNTYYGTDVQHQYQSSGTYNVTLTIKDDLGAVQTVTEEIIVVDQSNGSFEIDNVGLKTGDEITGWKVAAQNGAIGTFQVHGNASVDGDQSFRCVIQNVVDSDRPWDMLLDNSADNLLAFSAGDNISVSFYAKANIAGKKVRLKFRDSANSNATSQDYTLSAEFEKYTLNVQIPESRADYRTSFFLGFSGGTIWIDHVQIVGVGSMTSKASLVNKDDEKLVVEPQNTLMLYPNPVSDYLNLIIPEEEQIESLYLSDLRGRIVFTQNNLIGKGNFQIDMSKYKDGLYFITTHSISEELKSYKVLVK